MTIAPKVFEDLIPLGCGPNQITADCIGLKGLNEHPDGLPQKHGSLAWRPKPAQAPGWNTPQVREIGEGIKQALLFFLFFNTMLLLCWSIADLQCCACPQFTATDSSKTYPWFISIAF